MEAIKEDIYENISNPYNVALRCASKELRNDKEVVIAATKYNVFSLEYASKELRNNKEVIMAAIKDNPRSFEFASEELRNNKEVVMEAVKKAR